MSTVDEQGAKWIGSPFFWPGRYNLKPKFIIIHGTAGGSTPEETAAWFQNKQSQASAHYIIGRDGSVVQCVREADSAWANGGVTGIPGKAVPGAGVYRDSWWNPDVNPNLLTISIEHVKPDKLNQTALTQAQTIASFRLIYHICQRWGIPMRAADANGGITGHYSMDANNRANCPGSYPWDNLWQYLYNAQHPKPPAPTATDLAQVVASLQKQAQDQSTLLVHDKAVIDGLNKQVTELQGSVKQAQAALTTAQSSLKAAQEKATSDDNTIKNLQAQLAGSEEQLKAAQATVASLQNIQQERDALKAQEANVVALLNTVKPFVDKLNTSVNQENFVL